MGDFIYLQFSGWNISKAIFELPPSQVFSNSQQLDGGNPLQIGKDKHQEFRTAVLHAAPGVLKLFPSGQPAEFAKKNPITRSFRYLKWRVSWTLCSAILGMGKHPLHKPPYIQLIFRWVRVLHLDGTWNVWWRPTSKSKYSKPWLPILTVPQGLRLHEVFEGSEPRWKIHLNLEVLMLETL